MSQTFTLFRLQQIDSQLDHARARLREIERQLSEDEALLKAQKEAAEADRRLQEANQALRHTEHNVSAQRVKIEQAESALYGGRVRNPKELQDLQNDAAALKRFLGVLEDRQLESMLWVEEAETTQQAAASRLKEVQAQAAQQNSSLVYEQTNLRKEVERAEIERRAAVSSVDGGDLRLYEQLRQQRRGVAVAHIKDNCCSACGTTLNASLLHAARTSGQISRCDSCGRILYSG